MIRQNWRFKVTLEKLREAIAGKCDYHESRTTNWTSERAKALSDIKGKGLEFRDHQVTGGTKYEVVVDTELAKHLSNCESKLGKHKEVKKVFDGWFRTVEAETDKNRVFDLDIDDINFFGL